ncbi:MAG: arginine--tRNA ligase [Frankia sp.]
MTPAELTDAVVGAVRDVVAAGDLDVAVPTTATVERPKIPEHGDYATPVALQLAKPARRRPREIAELLAVRLRAHEGIAAVEIAGPGFLNIRLAGAALGEIARTVVRAGPDYGRSEVGAKTRINLEFVSANPTGPVTLASTRWAAVGDTLARLFTATGSDVGTEYYFNDAGAQIERFGRSVLAVARGEEPPADGYQGGYIAEVAQRVQRDHPGLLDEPEDVAVTVATQEGIALMLDQIKASLRDFGVGFDTWFSERTLHEDGSLEAAIEQLRANGHTYEADGALWLRTTDFADDKDRVIIRSGGAPTYFSADAAYYLNKRRRGFDRVVILLGADHHGYVGRLRAMAACFGDDPDETLEVVIGQLVNLSRGGQPVRMSKRAGTFLTLEDLVGAVGVDAARYSLVRSSMDSTLDLDLDLLSRRSSENPVFYVQYAHSRIQSVMRAGQALGLRPGVGADVGLLTEPREGDLLRALGEFPRVVASAAELRAPHRVPRYLEELAGTYHRFYDSCRILPQGDEEPTPLTDARLLLAEATRVVIANGLALLGVSAPERM